MPIVSEAITCVGVTY